MWINSLNLTELAFMAFRHTELKLKICYRTGKKFALPLLLKFVLQIKKVNFKLNLTDTHSSRKSKVFE